MLQCPEIMLQAHQMMKTEVCSAGEPHMAPAAFWACQISQLPYSQWQQTPSLHFLPPNMHSSFHPSFQIASSLPETKPPKRSSIPWLYCRNHKLSSCCISFRSEYVPGLLMAKRDHYFSLFNEMTKQQICICRSRCCNRFDDSWPKACKMIYQQQLSLRYLGSDGQSKLHHLHHRVLKMTIWIKSWSTNLIQLMPSISSSICWIPKKHNTWIIYYKYQSLNLNKIRQSRKMWKVSV